MSLPPQVADLRGSPRHRTLIGGRICYGPSAAISLDCVIRNIGANGAMLAVPVNQLLPATFYLVHVMEGVAFDARLVWRIGERTGVRFTGRHDLRAPQEGDLKAVRAIWLALAPS